MREYQPVKVETESMQDERIDLNVFTETQKFDQWWLWLIMMVPVAVVAIPFLIQLFTGSPVGNNPAPTYVLGIICLFTIALPFLFSRLILKTHIDQKRIRMSYGILGNKNIEWSDVEKVDVVNYGFVGYGLRMSHKFGTVYNVDGKYGLFITLKSGKKITIGTQKKEELEDFLGQIGRGLS